MPIEAKMLVWSLAILLVLILVQVTTLVITKGLPAAAGNRDGLSSDKPGFPGRLDRAIENLKESLFFFIPLVIFAAILGVSNEMTVMGAQLFVGARLVHAFLYLAGIPWLRTFAFLAGLVGIIMVALGLGLPGALFA